MDLFSLEQALTPQRDKSPRVSLRRGTVTGLGLVRTAADTEGQPVDGPTGTTGQGAVLSVDGHRVFLPYQGGAGGGGTPPGGGGGTDLSALEARIAALEAGGTGGGAPMAAGAVFVTHPGGAVSTSTTITFPTGRFTAAPGIALTPLTSSRAEAAALARFTATISPESATVWMHGVTGMPSGTVLVSWIAAAAT